MSLKPADSWYEATARRDAPLAPLEGDIDADVCVVGAGLSGCSTAMHLAQRGYKVVVLEAERIGYGASGRSGGQIIPGWAGGMDKIAAQLGKDDAKRVWDFSIEGVDMTRELIERNRIDCELAWGHMHVALKPRQRQELLDMQREQEGDFGYRKLRFMEREETGSWIASQRYIAGLLDAGAGHLHPLRYTIGVGKAAIAAGAQVYEHSAVTDIAYGPTVTVKTAKGSVRAKFVALCANVGHVDLSARLARKLIGVASYIVATQAARRGARTRAAARQHRGRRPQLDHRLLPPLGRPSPALRRPRQLLGTRPARHRRATRQRMLNVFPQLADVEIDYAWGGMIDITMSRLPNFGRLEPNVYYLQGYSGHGMVATTIAGRIAAEAIAGQAERFDIFARLKHHDFPGGSLFRRPTLVMAMTWFRLRDLMP